MKTWYETILFYSAVALMLSISIFGFIRGNERSRAIGEIGVQFTEYRSLSDETLGLVHGIAVEVEQSRNTLNGVSRRLEDVSYVVDELTRENRVSGDAIIELGIDSDENVRIIRELRRRATESGTKE